MSTFVLESRQKQQIYDENEQYMVVAQLEI